MPRTILPKILPKSEDEFSPLIQSLTCHICGKSIKTTINFYNHLIKDHDKLELSLCILELLKLVTPQNGKKTNTNFSTEQNMPIHVSGFFSIAENCKPSATNHINSDGVNQSIVSYSDRNRIILQDVNTSISNPEKNENTPQSDTPPLAKSSSVENTIESVPQCFGVKEKICSSVQTDPVLPASRPVEIGHVRYIYSASDSVDNHSESLLENPCANDNSDVSQISINEEDKVSNDAIVANPTLSCTNEIGENPENSQNHPESSTSIGEKKLFEEQSEFFSQLGLMKYSSFCDLHSPTSNIPTVANVLAEIEATKSLYSFEESFNFRIPVKFFTEGPLPEDSSIFEPLLSPLLGIAPKKLSEEMNTNPATESNLPAQPLEKTNVPKSGVPCHDNPEKVTSTNTIVSLADTSELQGSDVSGIQSLSLVSPENTVEIATDASLPSKSEMESHCISLGKSVRQETPIFKSENIIVSTFSHTDPSEKASESNKFDANNFINLVSKLVSSDSPEQKQLDTLKNQCSIDPDHVRIKENQITVSCTQNNSSASNSACDNDHGCKSVVSTDTDPIMSLKTQVFEMKSVESGKPPNSQENFSDKIVRLLSETYSRNASTALMRSKPTGDNEMKPKMVASTDTQTVDAEFKASRRLTNKKFAQIPPLVPINDRVIKKPVEVPDSNAKIIESSIQTLQNSGFIGDSQKVNFDAVTSFCHGSEKPKQELTNAPMSSQIFQTHHIDKILSTNETGYEISQKSKSSRISEVTCSTEVSEDSCLTSSSQKCGVELKPNVSPANGDQAEVSSSQIGNESNDINGSMACLPFLIGANGVFWQVFETQNSPNPVQILRPVHLLPNHLSAQGNQTVIEPGMRKRKYKRNALLKSKKTKTKEKTEDPESNLIKLDEQIVGTIVDSRNITEKTQNSKLPLNLAPKLTSANSSSNQEVINHQNSIDECSNKSEGDNGNSNPADSSVLNNANPNSIGNMMTSNYMFPISMYEPLKDVDPSNSEEMVGELRFVCTFCDKYYAKKNHLIRHVRMHMNQRPYKCEHCDKSFTTTSILKQHKRCHSGERPFVCPVCSKTFAQKSSLLTHSMLHNGKRFKCYFCRKAFVSNHKLQRHLRVHNVNDSGLYCCVCEYQFAVEGAFMEHLVMAHNYVEPVETEEDKKMKKRRKLPPVQPVPMQNVLVS